MILLNRGYFYPMLILLSFLCLPIITIGFLCFFSGGNLAMLIGIVAVVIIYFILVWVVHKISKSAQYYLVSSSRQLKIHYPNIAKNNSILIIENEKVIQFDYCRLSSVKAWFLMPIYDLPQCVFITFIEDGIKVCKLIGYMSYSDIQMLAKKTSIKLIIH